LFTKNKDKLLTLPVGAIHPNSYQPRTHFDQGELGALSESIKLNGLLQPVTVRRRDDGYYELIAGERRLRACKMAGLTKIPCVVMQMDDRKSAILGLVENVQRQDLNFFEEAESLNTLMTEWGATQSELAEKIGKSPSTIANKLRLLRLSADQRTRILSAGLGERHARALLRLEDDTARNNALTEIITKKMNSAETERYISTLLDPDAFKKRTVRTSVVGDVRVFINTLSRAVETMRKSGFDAQSDSTETESYIEYRVIIPKGDKVAN